MGDSGLDRAGVISLLRLCPFRTSVEHKWQNPQDLPGRLLDPLSELKSHGFDTLLQRLFGDLKVLEPPQGACRA